MAAPTPIDTSMERDVSEDVNDQYDELAGISRRSIYFHRLIGDVFEQHQTQFTKRAPWHVVFRFIIYAAVASWAIWSRTDIENLSQVNMSIRAQLQQEYFFDPRDFQVKNLSRVDDPQSLLRWVVSLMYSVEASFRYGLPLSLTSYNRVVPMFGMCPEVATIAITFRRMEETSNYKDTTTERFRALYPRAWAADTLSSDGQNDDTSPIEAFVTAGGACGDGGNGSHARLAWRHVEARQKWAFNQEGGLVALLAVESNTSNVRLYLVNGEATPTRQPEAGTGTCFQDPSLVELTMGEFFCFAFVNGSSNSDLAFLGAEFTTYNANMQSLTFVHTFVQMNAAGFLEDQGMTTDTIRMDTYSSYLQYVDAAYFMGTCCYLVGLCRDICSLYPDILKDGWTYINAVSIFCSFMSLLLWYIYTSQLSTFKQTSDFQEPQLMWNQISLYRLYIRFSAFATLLIYFRILQFLGKTQLRVKLLISTMYAGAVRMTTYVMYVMIVCVGSIAFAYTKFSAESRNFTTLSKTIRSCFDMHFGTLKPMEDVRSGFLSTAFLVFYMVIFYIITSQMFNAILNYSYNRTYEHMEPELKRQEQSKQNKQVARKVTSSKEGKSHAVLRLKQHLQDRVFSKHSAQDILNNEEKKTEQDQAAVGNLPDELKAKVMAHIDRHKKMKPREGVVNWMLFAIFMASYVVFLWVNLYIPANALIRRAIEASVSDASFAARQDSLNGMLVQLNLDDTYKLRFAARWISDALETIGEPFDSTGEGPSHCLNQWNCIVALAEHGTGEPKVFRVTSRRYNVTANEGTKGSSTPTEDRFIGGFVEVDGGMQDMSRLLAPYRVPSVRLEPDTGNDQDLEDHGMNFTLRYNTESACETKAPGEGGYGMHGGIVCLLDANRTHLHELTTQMAHAGLFGFNTGSIAVEFMVYTGHVNVLSYVSILFTLLPGGMLRKDLYIQPMRLFDMDQAGTQTIFTRIVPGILYLVLVLKFLWNLGQELLAEKWKHTLMIKDNKSTVRIAFEFIMYDAFNLMELISITLSIVSAVLFVIWLVQELDMQEVKGRGFSEFLDFGADLANRALTYNRLSAINLLVIFIRPLKFARNNARVIQFYQTLSQTFVDMIWFLCITIIILVGFVVFAYIGFGTRFEGCSTVPDTFGFCFTLILGKTDYSPLVTADAILAPVFIVPFLIIFRYFILKIFFAIIDRRFVTADPPPPETLKRTLKPLLRHICPWCVDWDEDHTLNADRRSKKKDGPPSRAERVHRTAQEIERIRFGIDGEQDRIAMLSDVCETDGGQLHEVLQWSRQEAFDFVHKYKGYLAQKQESRDEADFVQNFVMPKVEKDALEVQRAMEEAERYVRYDTNVHEKLVMHDQETLAKYIQLLESKIKGKLAEKHALHEELYKLRAESDCMRFTQEEMRGGLDGSSGDGGPPGAGGAGGGAAGSSAGGAYPRQTGSKEEEKEDEEDSSDEEWERKLIR